MSGTVSCGTLKSGGASRSNTSSVARAKARAARDRFGGCSADFLVAPISKHGVCAFPVPCPVRFAKSIEASGLRFPGSEDKSRGLGWAKRQEAAFGLRQISVGQWSWRVSSDF